jgi:hypothetical protein
MSLKQFDAMPGSTERNEYVTFVSSIPAGHMRVVPPRSRHTFAMFCIGTGTRSHCRGCVSQTIQVFQGRMARLPPAVADVKLAEWEVRKRDIAMATGSWRHTARWWWCLGLEGRTVGFEVGLLRAQRPPTCGRLKQPLEQMQKYYREVPVGRNTTRCLSPVSSLSIVHYVSVQVRCPKTEDLFLVPQSA